LVPPVFNFFRLANYNIKQPTLNFVVFSAQDWRGLHANYK